jgi:hypothetical protein
MLSHLLNRRGWVPQHGLFSEQAIRRTSGSLLWPQKLRQLGDIGRDPPRFVFGEQFCCRSPARLILEIA